MLRTAQFIVASAAVFTGALDFADETASSPDGWKPQVVRDEIAPRFWAQYPSPLSCGPAAW
jgi:hypothetical protein